jgi:hypothetical protein
MARSSMAALISRVRLLINDSTGGSQQFTDDEIQDVLDESRQDVVNQVMISKPTFSGSSIQYLNYYTPLGGWETDYVLKQYLTISVTPASVEPIPGHFVLSTSTLPPIYITGKIYDVYRAAADLLERWSAIWVKRYNVVADGQNLQRGQMASALLKLADSYRMKQRAVSVRFTRSDIAAKGNPKLDLGATPLDYMASGNGNGG